MGFLSEASIADAWSRYDRQFSNAEYAIKICEHLSAELSENSVIELSKSGEYAVAALRVQSAHPEIALKKIEKACEYARSATKEALRQGIVLMAENIGAIWSKYGDDAQEILSVHIPNFSEHKSNLSRLTELLRGIKSGEASRKRDFAEQSRDVISRAIKFVDEYTIKAGEIDKHYEQKRKEWRDNTWGKVIGAVAGFVVGVIFRQCLLYLIEWGAK